jgi:phosphoribosylanthranilate isomerase
VFRIKICGITNVDDALAAAEAGADAIGLNFYAKSPRHVSADRAREIREALPTGVVCVGLFVNASVEFICDTFDHLRLDLVQLHGDEPPALLSSFGHRPIMRAFRVGESGLLSVDRYLSECSVLRCVPRLALLDACVPGQYGGTGTVPDWSALKAYPTESWHPPLVLAGGLTPLNVAEAIRIVRPAVVDTASGVETAPGRKDPAAMVAFVRAAREAFADGGNRLTSP